MKDTQTQPSHTSPEKVPFRFIVNLFFITFLLLPETAAFAAQGLSLGGALKYPIGFKKFDYASELAVKGGDLVLHDIGSFDKMNPFTLKGAAPLGLEELIFEPLAVSSLDEPFAKYGLIAEDIVVAKDLLSMKISIDEKAAFADGTSITAEDVSFSFEIMKSDKVHPLYASYFHDIQDVEIIDDHNLKILFAKENRELPLIALSVPILSKSFYKKHEFGVSDTLVKPLGSGPYRVETFNQGKTIVYKRNPDYWAKDKNIRRGMYNFDNIIVKYYQDRTVSVEAFKAGEFDVQSVNIAKQWARDLTGLKFENGTIIKKVFPHHNNAGMQCFVMNTRRPLFKDMRVRKALGLAFDFEWTNNSLFFGQYTRSDSFFSNSYLAAKGLPEGLELQYLDQFKNKLPKEVFTKPLTPPINHTTKDFRQHLREAQKLLRDAGWKVQDGILTNEKGEKFEFEILLVMPSFSRVVAPYAQNLEKLGINVTYRVLDQALYIERVQEFDFDMVVNVFSQSQSPGNEQKNYWTSKAADIKGSGNLAGIKSDAIDIIVDKLVYASNQEELVAACKALDRVLWYGYYVIPNWHLSGHRMVYYNKFLQPKITPLYYNYFDLLLTWWQKFD